MPVSTSRMRFGPIRGHAGDAKLGRDLHLNRLFPPLSYESA
ncbi:hypothetical protein NSND_50433 [Nitrospira sp. ND1]|nr:hypothetical protein NSND_50433 [Nitrospira sp. ND1]